MAQMAQKLVLVLALASFLDMILGMEYVVGGDVQKWDFLHTNDSPNLYNNWAANQTFKTGGILRRPLTFLPIETGQACDRMI